MKRITALLLVCLICFALASCSKKNTDSTPDSATPDSSAAGSAAADSAAGDNAADKSASSGSAESDTASEEVTPTQKPEGAKYATIADYLEDPKVKESLGGVNESVDEVISFTYYAEDNTLFYNYNYNKVYDEKDLEIMKKSHANLLDENDESNKKVLSALRENTEVENPKLVVTYYNGNGEVIATRIYE